MSASKVPKLMMLGNKDISFSDLINMVNFVNTPSLSP